MDFLQIVPDDAAARAGAKAPRWAWHRARPVPATEIPGPRTRQRTGTIISLVVHALLLMLLLQPEALNTDPNLVEIEQGGGGPGPAGGGGGGTGGTGGIKYVRLLPPPPAVVPPPTQAPTIVPVIEPPKPVVEEPVLPAVELPKLSVTPIDIKPQSPIIGSGGGIGHDGTVGNGPGTGGGIGSGIGTGSGSGVGPGTGGGGLDHYPCTTVELIIPPQPTPAKVKGSRILANFDVDERGKLIGFKFSPTKDGAYNKKLDEVFKQYRFRPGTTLTGVPIRTTCQISIDL